jgi:hypothetical protein
VKTRLKVKQMNLYIFIDLFASIYTCTRGTASRRMDAPYAAGVGSKEAILEVPWRWSTIHLRPSGPTELNGLHCSFL